MAVRLEARAEATGKEFSFTVAVKSDHMQIFANRRCLTTL